MSSPAPSEIVRIDLRVLATGFPHLSAAIGGFMAEAAAVALDRQGHPCGVKMGISGGFSRNGEIHWDIEVTRSRKVGWDDPDVLAEWGAYGIAILAVRELTGLTVIERAQKQSGVDWWLGSEDDLFQRKARLEVSAIMKGNKKAISDRAWKKREQSKQSDATKATAYVVVVEFSTPISRIDTR